jgi:general secretion pathway protein D
LGFDLYLGNVVTSNGAIGGQASNALPKNDSPAATNPLAAFPGNPPGPAATPIAGSSTGQVLTSGAVYPSASSSTLTGILTDPQFRVVIKALQQRKGAELLGEPEVTIISARQAQIKITTIQRVATGISDRALTPPGITATNGDESPLY